MKNEQEQVMTPEERTKLIKKFQKKILKALKDVDKTTLNLHEDLIMDAAQYACSIYECRLLYIRDGLESYYQNGENQWGTKKTVSSELRPKYTAAYQSLIKQLSALLPTDSEKNAAAELMSFLESGRK